MKLTERTHHCMMYIMLMLFAIHSAATNAQHNPPLDHVDYQGWKKEIQSDWMKKNLTLVQQLHALTQHLNYEIRDEEPNTGPWSKALLYSYNAARKLLNALTQYINHHRIPDEGLENQSWSKAHLYRYNFARELLNESPAPNATNIDKKWIDDLEETIDPYKVAEDEGLPAPLVGMRELLHEARTILAIKKKLVAVADIEEYNGGAKSHYISLCQTPDLDLTLAVLYHELGHVINNDYELSSCLLEIDPHCRDRVNIPTSKDAEMIKKYRALGLKHINTKSSVGKKVLKVLARLKNQGLTLYDYIDKKTPKMDPPVTPDTIIHRNKERRADIYALNELYRLGKIEPILSTIEQDSHGTTTMPFDDIRPLNGEILHPSFLERVIYMIGFLIDKGLDANALLKHYESEGICVSREDLEKSPVSPAREAFEKVYAQWQQQKFEEYKKQQLSEYKTQRIQFGDRVTHLIENIHQSIDELWNAPAYPTHQRLYHQTHALYAYNVLRDLLVLPHAKTLYEIDNKWLGEQEKKYKKGIFRKALSKFTQLFRKNR